MMRVRGGWKSRNGVSRETVMNTARRGRGRGGINMGMHFTRPSKEMAVDGKEDRNEGGVIEKEERLFLVLLCEGRERQKRMGEWSYTYYEKKEKESIRVERKGKES